MTTAKSTHVATQALESGTASPASTGEACAPALEEPVAGGNYVRDPVTGALSLNPSHLPPEPPLE